MRISIESLKIWSVLYTLVSTALCHVRSLRCEGAVNPPEEELHKRYREWVQWLDDDNYLHESFQIIPNFFHKIKSGNEDLFSMASGNRFSIGEDRRCHRNIKEHHDDKFISTCPYFTVMTVNEYRYPKYMATAQCTCPHCYDNEGKKPGRRERRKRKRLMPTKCEEIPYTYKVLKRRVSSKGEAVYCDQNSKTGKMEYDYIEAYENFTIGCTCMLRNDVIADSPSRVVPGI